MEQCAPMEGQMIEEKTSFMLLRIGLDIFLITWGLVAFFLGRIYEGIKR